MDIFALKIGLLILFLSAVISTITVILMRRFTAQSLLIDNYPFLKTAYPTVGMIYGVFLAFTIVITWGEFNDADASATTEVAHLSELWWNSEGFSQEACREVHTKLASYASQVIADDFASMADRGRHSEAANASYFDLWKSYYSYQPTADRESRFYSESIRQLNELGTARRHRELLAGATIPPMVSVFLIGGGVITVMFLLLLPCPSAWIQIFATTLVAALVGFSVFLVLSFQRPFSGDLSVDASAFTEIVDSFNRRSLEQHSCSYVK